MGKIERNEELLKDSRGSVHYVAAARAPRLAEELLEHGLRPETPVALVVRGSAPNLSDTDLAGYGAAWFRS